MDLKNSTRKYDTHDSMGQRVRFWRKSEINAENGYVYGKKTADIYEKDSDNSVGVVNFIFVAKHSSELKLLPETELIEMLSIKVKNIKLLPKTTQVITLSNNFNDTEFFDYLRKKYSVTNSTIVKNPQIRIGLLGEVSYLKAMLLLLGVHAVGIFIMIFGGMLGALFIIAFWLWLGYVTCWK